MTAGLVQCRVDVEAASVADIVRRAGGWMTEPLSRHHSLFLSVDELSDAQYVEHRLSAAAHRFKEQALIAGHLDPTSVDTHESFGLTMQGGRLVPEVFDTQEVTAVSSS